MWAQRSRSLGLIGTILTVSLAFAALPCLAVAQTPDRNQELMEAVKKGSAEEVMILLNGGANANAKLYGQTALGTAAWEGHVAVLRVLLDKGADVNAQFCGRTALMWAARSGRTEVMEVLLAHGAHVTAKDNDGRTPLMYAAEYNRLEAMKMLLAKGSDATAKDDDGKTPLIWAVQKGHPDAVKLLLDQGVSVNAMDSSGRTALAHSSWRSDQAMVTLLKERGAVRDGDNASKSVIGQVVASTPKQLSLRLGVASADTDLINIRVGLKTKFIPFRRPAVGEKVMVEYRFEGAGNFAEVVKVVH